MLVTVSHQIKIFFLAQRACKYERAEVFRNRISLCKVTTTAWLNTSEMDEETRDRLFGAQNSHALGT